MTTLVEIPGSTLPCPQNLHLSVGCPQSGRPPLVERVEQKFFVVPQKASLALALLWRTCRPDSLHPKGQVNSLYFDTRDLDEHQRSDAGDFAKDKIRIRWYGSEHDPHRAGTRGRADDGSGRGVGGHETREALFGDGDREGSWDASDALVGEGNREARDALGDNRGKVETPGLVEVWLERKTRRGFASTKQRLAMDVPAEALAFAELKRGIVPRNLLLQTMAAFGFFVCGELCPVIAISYGRYRFVEPRSGFRVSLDYRVRSSMVMAAVGNGERALELPGVVVEVKGSRFEVPAALQSLAEIGSSWTRFSKYSSSIEGHQAAMGAVARLWPNGTIETVDDDPTRVPHLGDAGAADSPAKSATQAPQTVSNDQSR